MRLSLEGDRAVEPLLQTRFNELNAELSPDGRWLAYESDESGTPDIFVRPFPDVSAGRWQVSNGGGRAPRWSHRGDELYFLGGRFLMIKPAPAPDIAVVLNWAQSVSAGPAASKPQ